MSIYEKIAKHNGYEARQKKKAGMPLPPEPDYSFIDEQVIQRLSQPDTNSDNLRNKFDDIPESEAKVLVHALCPDKDVGEAIRRYHLVSFFSKSVDIALSEKEKIALTLVSVFSSQSPLSVETNTSMIPDCAKPRIPG